MFSTFQIWVSGFSIFGNMSFSSPVCGRLHWWQGRRWTLPQLEKNYMDITMLCSSDHWVVANVRAQKAGPHMHLFTSLDYMIISLIPFVIYYAISLFSVVIYLVPDHYQCIWKRLVNKRRWLMTIFLSVGWGYYQLFPKELILSPYIWLMKFIQLSLKVVLDCYLSINSNMCSMHVKRHLCVFHCCGALCYAFSYMVVCLHCIIKIKNTNLHTC